MRRSSSASAQSMARSRAIFARSNRIRMRARFWRSASGTWVRTLRSSTCTAWGGPYTVPERRRLTLIRPPVVNRESSPAAGCFPREKDTTWGPRGAADFISRAASDTVVCTKHLLRLELETTTCSRHQRGEQPRLRGLETHLCLLPADSKRRALAEGQSQLARSSGEGQPTARRVNVVPSDVERARESNQRTGLRDLRAQMLARGRGRTWIRSIRSGSVPCWVQLDGRLSRAPRARSVAQARPHLSSATRAAASTTRLVVTPSRSWRRRGAPRRLISGGSR